MNAPVTRGEIKELIDGAVDGAVARLERVISLGFGTLDAKIDRRYSDTISHLDAFMAQTLKARGE